MLGSFNQNAAESKNEFCYERRSPRRKQGDRYFVTYKKPGNCPAFVEVTVVAGSYKDARKRAAEIVRPIKGLVGGEVD